MASPAAGPPPSTCTLRRNPGTLGATPTTSAPIAAQFAGVSAADPVQIGHRVPAPDQPVVDHRDPRDRTEQGVSPPAS